MMDLGQQLADWAETEASIRALFAIGSRSRAAGSPGAADRHSDWDFQIIAAEPALFDTPAWCERAGLGRPTAYVLRSGRLGGVRKVTAVTAGGEIDAVIIAAAQFVAVRAAVQAESYRESPLVWGALRDQGLVLAGGFRRLKDEIGAEELFRWVERNLPPPRLSEAEIVELAEGFVCDYVSTLRKIARGELVAAQRWLHAQLAETNFRLLHEVRRRRGQASFPDARRLELLATAEELGAVRIEATLEARSLRAAAGQSATGCAALVRALVGDAWRWPELPSGLRVE
ncbi:MAG: hypothetical protein B9S34_07140 [Opitutia bacterium Tous-C1TDCM]|nr:MAG: hypothetical protein B9S34_07140 [Opitutae bacterium Tous-C1TDCM]